jgi:hypothetical protein
MHVLLTSGQRLYPEQEVRSGDFKLRLQGLGNLVLSYRDVPVWASGTHGRPPLWTEMQVDGHLLVRFLDNPDDPWKSDTFGDDSVLCVNDKGELEINARTVLRAWPLTLPQAPVHPDPLEGQVRLVRGAWGDATGPRNIAGLHLGNLIGHGLTHGLASILPTLDLAAECGYHEIRSWFQLKTNPGGWWDQWSTPRWNPADASELFFSILEAWASRGGRWHLAGGGIKDMTDGEEDAAFNVLNRAIRRIGPEHFSLIEACNEIRDTGDPDDIEPAELTRLVRIATNGFPQVLTALSAYTGTEDDDIISRYTPSWMGFYLVHGYRQGRAHDKIRHIFSLRRESPVRRNGKQSESFGPGRLVSVTDNKHEIDAHVMKTAAAMTALTSAAWTFMSGPGVVLETEALDAMPGLRETPALLRALPREVGTWDIVSHSGPTQRGTRIHSVRTDAPDVREDYAINSHTGEYLAIRYGPPDQRRDMPRERATHDDRVLEEGPWARITTGRLS